MMNCVSLYGKQKHFVEWYVVQFELRLAPWLKHWTQLILLTEILFNEAINAKSVQYRIPIKAYTDNTSLSRNTHSTTMAEHRLRIELAIIKQMLEKK